jgi:hypothetical protein
MFEISKLKRRIERIRRSYAEQHEELKKKNAPQNQLDQLEASADFAVQENEHEIDWIVSTRLSHEARSLDVETPPLSNKEMWEHDAGGPRVWLTSKGRAHVRNLIHEERKRRFEAKSRWIPLLSIVLAIIGTITSLVALTVQRKSAEAAATAAGTARIGVELARRQLVGTMGAVVVFMPSFSTTFIHPVLENRGHVVSRDAYITFRWGVAPLSNPEVFVRQGNYSNTIPQLIGGFDKPLDIGIELGQEFAKQKYTVKIEGSYDFDNGFGDRISDTFCYFYLAHYRTVLQDGGIETGGLNFWSCADFAQKVRYIGTHPPG